ncbi:MAG: hypothetical protein ACRD1C_14405 [Terriglobales bacterium]
MPDYPQSWKAYSYVNDQPLTLVDPLGTCATVKLNDTNSDGDEASGDFGPYVSQDETAAGSADGGNIQQCLIYGSTNPWDPLEIDGGSVDSGMAPAGDLEHGGPDGTGAAVGALQTYSIGRGLQTTAYQTDINGTPEVQPTAAECGDRLLTAVDNQFGTIPLQWNINTGGIAPGGGEYNLTMSSTSLTPSQFGAIDLGRYASLATMITGIGSSLHVAGRSALDPGAFFAKTDAGGVPSLTMTVHLDSGYAYNPLGLLIHTFGDVLGHATRDACPND